MDTVLAGQTMNADDAWDAGIGGQVGWLNAAGRFRAVDSGWEYRHGVKALKAGNDAGTTDRFGAA